MSRAPDFRRLASLIAGVLGLYAIAGGGITLIGWFANLPYLTDWDGDGIAMFANTAVMAACAGLALVLRSTNAPWATQAIRALSLLVALIGGATLFEHASGIALGIDDLLVSHAWGNVAAVAPGRPGPPASLSFVLLGFGMALSTFGNEARRVVAPIAMLVAGIATLSLVGFMFMQIRFSPWRG